MSAQEFADRQALKAAVGHLLVEFMRRAANSFRICHKIQVKIYSLHLLVEQEPVRVSCSRHGV